MHHMRDEPRNVTLARFRADPKRVRIGVRWTAAGWLARIRAVGSDDVVAYVIGDAMDARLAVEMALGLAAKAHMPGLDLDMQWVYDHPWKDKCDT